MARETRLLLLTLAVSVGVLFLLARFRFPERPISELAAPQPLARLARTTTFDDLSATLSDFLQRAGDASVTLRVGQAGGDRLVPALRVRDDLALAVVSGDAWVESVESGEGEASGGNVGNVGNVVVARDEVRGLVLVRVPARPTPSLPVQPQGDTLGLPGFLVIVDAAPGGPAVRAEFVSRVTLRPHPAWDAPVMSLAGLTARAGAMVFTIGGRFVGMVLPDDDETIVVPGDTLIARADRLTRGESVLAADAGLAVQPLSPALAKATHADHGVIIAAIDGAVIGGSAGSLRVGDVIAAIGDDEIHSVTDWERALSRRAPGTTVPLRLVRRTGTSQTQLVLAFRHAPLAPGDDGKTAAAARSASAARRAGAASADVGAGAATLGLWLRSASSSGSSGNGSGGTLEAQRVGSGGPPARAGVSATPSGGAALEVLRVDPDSPAARARLHAGDRLIALPGLWPARSAADSGTTRGPRPRAGSAASSAPMPLPPLTLARVDAAFKALGSGDAILLAISRAGQPLMVAVEKP